MTASYVAASLGKHFPKSGGGFMACCPAHDDKVPSLAIDQADNGSLLFHCFAGCEQEVVIERLKDRNLWPVRELTPLIAPSHAPIAEWQPILPVPTDAPKPPITHHKLGKPSAIWYYRNQVGELLCIVCRFDLPVGKQILPAVYATNGGRSCWRWQALPEPRSLYGLELLSEGKQVLVCEGEKATDAARRLVGTKFLVVTWPGGSNAVSKVDWSPLAGRGVTIWPDADEPGVKAALAVAGHLMNIGCTVKIVESPDGIRQGWDLADAEAQGWTETKALKYLNESLSLVDFKVKHLRSVAEVASVAVALSGDEWPPHLPLVADILPEPYPIDALPVGMRAAVEEVQKFVKAPVALVASSALGALSTAAQSLVDVKRAEKLIGPTSLFLLSLAESGERKTTVDGFFSEAIRAYQIEEYEQSKQLMVKAQADLSAWEAKRNGILDAIKAAAKGGRDTDSLEVDLERLDNTKPALPRVPELLRGDDTPEALAYDLANRWPAGSVISSEAGVVFGSAGMSRERALRNLSLLNVLWDGGELPIKRKTGDHFTVRGARLTLSLQVQEAALLEFFKQTGQLARGTGFLARFLVSCPASTQGQRLFSEAPKEWPHLSIYNDRILTLLRTPSPVQEDGSLSPETLTFSPEAKLVWIGYHDQVETMLKSGGELSNVRDVASKSADNAARIAALLHVYQNGPRGQIGDDSFDSASRIAAWHLNEALRFFGGISLPVELSAATRLDAWLIDYCKQHGEQAVPRRTIQQYGPGCLRDKHTLDAAIEELSELSRARLVIDGKRKDIILNPALLEV